MLFWYKDSTPLYCVLKVRGHCHGKPSHSKRQLTQVDQIAKRPGKISTQSVSPDVVEPIEVSFKLKESLHITDSARQRSTQEVVVAIENLCAFVWVSGRTKESIGKHGAAVEHLRTRLRFVMVSGRPPVNKLCSSSRCSAKSVELAGKTSASSTYESYARHNVPYPGLQDRQFGRGFHP